MKTAIYGAGSLGTVLGAYMTKAGIPVELVNRNKAHVEALNEKGARISGTTDMTVPVKAILPEQMEGIYDVIFLMTKQLHNREVYLHGHRKDVLAVQAFPADPVCDVSDGCHKRLAAVLDVSGIGRHAVEL